MPQTRKMTDEQYARACALREEEGVTIAAIIRRLNLPVAKSTLLHHFVLDGVFPPKGRRTLPIAAPYRRNGMEVRPFTTEEDERALQMERDGISLGQIGKALGRSRNTVAYRLASLGYALDQNAA